MRCFFFLFDSPPSPLFFCVCGLLFALPEQPWAIYLISSPFCYFLAFSLVSLLSFYLSPMLSVWLVDINEETGSSSCRFPFFFFVLFIHCNIFCHLPAIALQRFLPAAPEIRQKFKPDTESNVNEKDIIATAVVIICSFYQIIEISCYCDLISVNQPTDDCTDSLTKFILSLISRFYWTMREPRPTRFTLGTDSGQLRFNSG